MAHRHVDTHTPVEQPFPPAITPQTPSQPPGIIHTVLSKRHEVDELSGCIGDECGIQDSSELLFLNMVLRHVTSRSDREWYHVCKDMMLRILAAFMYRTAIHWAMESLQVDRVLQSCMVHTHTLMVSLHHV